MQSLIGLINKIQRACTVLGDHGGEGMSLWEALPSVAVVGGQVIYTYIQLDIHMHFCFSYFFFLFRVEMCCLNICFWFWASRVLESRPSWKAWWGGISFLVDPVIMNFFLCDIPVVFGFQSCLFGWVEMSEKVRTWLWSLVNNSPSQENEFNAKYCLSWLVWFLV